MELQAFCWAPAQREHVRDAHEVKAALWGFIGTGWLLPWLAHRGCLTLGAARPLRTEINPNTHNTSGQPRCTAPPRWTRHWSNRWGLCPAGRRGFPTPGAELPGWAHSSSCSSFLHRKPWLCNLLSRWDTGSGGERAKGDVRGSWDDQDTNPSLLAPSSKPSGGDLFKTNEVKRGNKKEMSVIALVLGTLLQIIPFSPGGSTAFLKGFSSHCKAQITLTSFST